MEVRVLNKIQSVHFHQQDANILTCFWKENKSIQERNKMSTVYYLCSQSECLADYKQSNRKRIIRFKCEGQLRIRVM